MRKNFLYDKVVVEFEKKTNRKINYVLYMNALHFNSMLKYTLNRQVVFFYKSSI